MGMCSGQLSSTGQKSVSMALAEVPLDGGIVKELKQEALTTIGNGVSTALKQGENVPSWVFGAEVLRTALKYALMTAFTYYSTKWLLSQLDPTQQQKRGVKERARRALKRIVDKTGKPDLLDKLSEHEIMIASQLIDPEEMTISWKDIAGLDDVIQEMHETVILPIRRADLFRQSPLVQAPKGVLLYGPPGCGKTLIAKATAKEAGVNFIHLDVSILTDKWYGESQKLAAAVFSLASKLQPCIVFIDEIDSLMRSRGSHDHEATAMMKTQFMSLWDGLGTDPDCLVIVMGATNRREDIDRAILRRMPASFHIKLPNIDQRQQILSLILRRDSVDHDVDVRKLAVATEGFSGSDLQELCRTAALNRIHTFLRNERANRSLSGASTSSPTSEDALLTPIKMQHFTTALNKMKNEGMYRSC